MTKVSPKMTEAHDDIEDFLDNVVVDPADAKDATPLRAIYRAVQAVKDAEAGLHAEVAAARAAGVSWTVIGSALGVTKQAAHSRFDAAKSVDPATGQARVRLARGGSSRRRYVI